MNDSRFIKLSKLLVEYCCAIKTGDHILIDVMDCPDDFAIQLMRTVRSAGGIPIIDIKHSRLTREVMLGTNAAHSKLVKEIDLFRMRKVQAYIAVRGSYNTSETSDVPTDKMQLYTKTMKPVLDYRVNKTRWVVLRWPTASMAQSANMSTEAFEDFYFKVCTMDYPKMANAMKPLVKRMMKADKVHIVGPGTDLSFSIKGIGAKGCNGKLNIPDGEVFSCPIKNSVNGVVQFNTPTVYAGVKFENIRLEFKDGKIIKATGSNERKLNEILNTDPGARYLGEFSLGFNPYIENPMCDILFDEKISGSLHLTPGQAYKVANNGNKSAIHWDMVLIQRKEWGGGEVWFDGELIRKDGLFIPADLKGLNPENLKSEN